MLIYTHTHIHSHSHTPEVQKSVKEIKESTKNTVKVSKNLESKLKKGTVLSALCDSLGCVSGWLQCNLSNSGSVHSVCCVLVADWLPSVTASWPIGECSIASEVSCVFASRTAWSLSEVRHGEGASRTAWS